MTATFLVTLELEAITPELLEVESSNMETALEGSGFPVISVAPWQRPTLSPTPVLGTQPPKDQLPPR